MKERRSCGATPFETGSPAAPPHFLGFRDPLGVAAALLLFSGCVGYSPRPIDPFHELEELERRASESRNLEVVPPGRPEWLPIRGSVDLSDGLDLAEANALALFGAPDVRAARSSQRVSGAQLVQAGLLANPEVFLGPRISTRSADVVFPAGLSWEVPLWGKRGAKKEVAGSRLSVARLRVLETEIRVLVEVRSTFVQIARLRQTLETLEARLAGSERVLRWVAALEQAGEVDAVTAYLASLERDDAKAALTTTRLELESRSRDLLATLGLLPDAGLPVALDPDPASLPELPALSPERLLLHPEIRAALAEHESAEASLKLEVAEQYPTIRVGPEFEDDRGDATVGIGVGIELPLFDRNRAGIVEAEERREAARERVRRSLLKMSHAEAQARAEWDAAERLLGDYRAGALESARSARASLEARLESGQSNVLEVLAALRSLSDARVRELELQSRSAVARFRAAVAGGAVFNAPSRDDSGAEGR